MKERTYNIAKYLILTVAILQLAMSQIHISIITKVFSTEVGIYLFMFVIFGLVTGFNATSSIRGGKVFLFIGGCLLACLTGGLYLRLILLDLQAGNILTFSEARLSIYIIIVSLVIYFAGGVTLVLTREKDD